MQSSAVLITGSDGYIGKRLARAYLELTDKPLVLWLRATDVDAFEAKLEKMDRQFRNFQSRIEVAWGDLINDYPFNSIDPRKVGTIIHTAAVTRFNVDPETAQRVNIEGTEKLLRFAGRCRSLDAFGLLSTVYASGLTSGPIAEAPFNGVNFANHYESSKHASETKLITEYDYLPWRILRVATVVADDAGGHVTQFNAFHNTLKLLYYGLLSIIPGKPDTPLYFVTAEFVTASVFNLMANPSNRMIYNVCHRKSESLTLGRLLDIAFQSFLEQPEFRSKRILQPLYADAESFDLLGDAMDTFGGSVVNQAMSSVSPFAKQLFVEKDFLNERLVAALPDYHAPEPEQVARNTCAYLMKTKWGRNER